MRSSDQGEPSIFAETTLSGEWSRLVRLCTQLSGSSEAAEDLAQETLYEAWRHRDQLHDPQGQVRWLTAIARNVCLRWRTLRFRDSAHLLQPYSHDLGEPSSLEQELADPADLEADVERSELADLLVRALQLLPAPTRHVLVARYVQELPYAIIAEQMGLREGTVKVQAHRGKLALRQVLTTQFREEASAYDFVTPEAVGWQTTGIWCPLCGQRHLEGKLERCAGRLCPPVPGMRGRGGRVYVLYLHALLVSWSDRIQARSQSGDALGERVLSASAAPPLIPGHLLRLEQTAVLLPVESQPEPQNRARGMLVCCAPCDQGGAMRLSKPGPVPAPGVAVLARSSTPAAFGGAPGRASGTCCAGDGLSEHDRAGPA